ncbi:protein FAR1-RELATED SEQUENCE 5-like [Silene latifolia]|uniref:protein FAR1-RELATED SEQUENCE 5-like n=1 Tax=Silene latifolia TaxID=37657 RepID=UPI003D78205A
MFVENLIGRKDTCISFYIYFIVDENKCLAGVFWSDLICIKNYILCGEVLSADATYGTNKYDMVFVPFTGVDHHKRCIIFGAGLIGDKSIECYTWMFKTFLEAMGGRQPRIIITDQDKSMKSVVPEVFKESTHRLCMWHIMKKLREKVSYQLFQDEDFKTRLNRCVCNNQLEPDEFEEQWGKIMTDYQLVEHKWFSDLYVLREQWIPAYFKDVSMSGLMRVTSRSESENSFFDRFLTPHLTLVEFWVCYESALEAQRLKQSKLNSENKHSEIPRKTKSNLEVHASEIVAECDDNDVKLLIEKMRDIRLDIISNRSVLANKKDKMKEIENYVGCKIPEKLVIHVPKNPKNKGRTKGKRIESQMLKALKKRAKEKRDIINLIGIVFPEYNNFKAFCTINNIVVLQEHNKLY